MSTFGHIRRTTGAWAASHQKTVLFLVGVFVSYGYFHTGLEADSWIVAAWRIITILLIALLLVSPLTQRKSARDQPQPDSGKDSRTDRDGEEIRDVPDEYYFQVRRDTEKNYRLFLDKILSIIKRTFAAHSAAVFLLENDKRDLRIKSCVSDGDLVMKRVYSRDEEFFRRLFQEMKSRYSNDPADVSALQHFYSTPAGVLSFIVAPILFEEDILGVLLIDSTDRNAFSDDDITLVETYAGILSETIITYNHLLDFEYSTHLFSFFYEVSRSLTTSLKFEEILDMLLAHMKNIIHYDRLTISAYEAGSDEAKIIRVVGQIDDNPEGMTFPLQEGLNGWIIRKRRPKFIPDLEKDGYFIPRYSSQEKTNYGLRSFLGAPISYHDVCFGIITVESRTPYDYTERHEKILAMLANNFGVALERSQVLSKLEMLATTDELTNVHNYRAFMQRLAEEIERAVRYESKFTLLMIDIDYFKEVNDRYGHLAGDRVLAQVADKIVKSTRTVDFVCRYGGEEFTVILVETALQKALPTADRIRKNIEDLTTRYKDTEIRVTASIGIVEFPNVSKDCESLINEADIALYRAKSKGRNQLVVYEKETESIS